VVTSATRALAEVRLHAARLPIPKFLVTASDLQHGKPHPEPYLKAAQLLGIAPSHCLVVEDAATGIRSGKTAGARVLALRTTLPESDLLRAGADSIVNDLSTVSVERQQPTPELALRLTGHTHQS
jgi:beta-phosphoglucomutase-like phosphatase (HAD superfamily)